MPNEEPVHDLVAEPKTVAPGGTVTLHLPDFPPDPGRTGRAAQRRVVYVAWSGSRVRFRGAAGGGFRIALA